jgi:stalled ribosome rescue protein Dom34
MKAIELVKKNQFEEAYKLILRDGDDMYFLRLVA